MGRNSGKFSRNGSGTFASNWGRSSPPPICARRNLPKPRSSSLLLPACLHARSSQHRRFSMVLPNGHVLPLREAFQVQPCPMGTSFLYGRLSRFSFHPPTGWDAALPRRSCALSSRAQTGARWLPSGLVCRSHWPLPRLSFARTVSRKQRHDQTTTGECGVLAAL